MQENVIICRSSKDLYRRKTINGWSKGCTFIWAFQISYLQIQAYFLLPIISRVSLNSYISQCKNLADEIALFKKSNISYLDGSRYHLSQLLLKDNRRQMPVFIPKQFGMHLFWRNNSNFLNETSFRQWMDKNTEVTRERESK